MRISYPENMATEEVSEGVGESGRNENK